MEIETPAASAVRDPFCSILAGVQHSILLRLLKKGLLNALYKIKLQDQKAEENSHGLLVLVEALLLLAFPRHTWYTTTCSSGPLVRNTNLGLVLIPCRAS